MSFPSIISNEPPPLDSTSEEDDSEEFTSPGLNLDLSAEPTPISTPRKTAKDPATLVNGHKDIVHHPDGPTSDSPDNLDKSPSDSVPIPNQVSLSTSEDEDEFKDCQDDEHNPVVHLEKQETVNGISEAAHPLKEFNINKDEDFSWDANPPLEKKTPSEKTCHEVTSAFETEQSFNAAEFVLETTAIDKNHEEDMEEQGFDDFQGFSTISTNCEPEPISPFHETTLDVIDNSVPVVVQSNEVIEESGFDDFEAFQGSEDINSCTLTHDAASSEMKTSYIGAVQKDDDDDDDDFGDFATTEFQAAAPTNSSIVLDDKSKTENIEAEDDFADFQDFKDAAVATPSLSSHQTPEVFTSIISPRASADFTAALDSKFDSLIKTLIPRVDSLPEPTSEEILSTSSENFALLEKELKESKDSCWSHTIDFEESRALLHKWLNSFCQQRLYRSLNIDTSTIVYTEKWGAIEVPRFAASMVETPILPQVCSSPSVPPKQYDVPSKTSPDDDNSNNPNKTALSKEAQQIIQRLPDLSYMTSKTLVFPQAASSNNSSLL